MPNRTVKVHVEVPDGVSEQAREAARVQAEETAVLALRKTGELSTRRAAEKLGLTYHEFLGLLAARGRPVVQGPLDEEALKEVRRTLITAQPCAGCLSSGVIQ
jgi:hypothetical protein